MSIEIDTAAVTVARESEIGLNEARALWRNAGFTDGMPEHEWKALPDMLANSNLLVAARAEGRLIGLARGWTDFVSVCHVADLMVDRQWRREGIGRRLIEEVRRIAGPTASLVLIANPLAERVYKQVGLHRLEDAWGS